MNNIGQCNIWEGMSLDQINEFKEEMQGLMPVVELMKIKSPPNSLSGLERDQKLRMMGYSTEQIENMTGFKHEIKLADESDFDEVEIFISDKDFPDQLKALNARIGLEREIEWNRIYNNGIALGFIEEELGHEPKL